MKIATMLKTRAESNQYFQKRVLFALLVDYYLFDYWKDLVPQLIEDGFNVTILVGDDQLMDKIKSVNPNAFTILLPPWIRWVNNRSGRIISRMMLWILGRLWMISLRRQFDFAIVPWDYRVLWYLIARSIPSLTIHNTTNFIDLDLIINYESLPEKSSKTLFNRILVKINSLLDNRLLPHANSQRLRFSKSWLVDKLMGLRSPNNFQGFSGIQYFTVMGERVRENYQLMGVGVGQSSTKIFVVGSPSYEQIRLDKLSKADIKTMRTELKIPDNVELFSLFLSPSSYDVASILEIRDVISCVYENRKNSWFVIKFHPKTKQGEPEKLRLFLADLNARVTMVTEFLGDRWNARLVLASDCLLQKQGTVGFIAMMHRIPILSYNLRSTEYFDDMYRIIGGSFHSTTREELFANLNLLNEEQGRAKLKQMQEEACTKFCRSDCSPCGEVSKIIQGHFH